MIIIGLTAIAGGLITFFLPETMDQPLPETLNEAELSGEVGWSTAKVSVVTYAPMHLRIG